MNNKVRIIKPSEQKKDVEKRFQGKKMNNTVKAKWVNGKYI